MQSSVQPSRSVRPWQPPVGFAVRAIQPEDMDFLCALYASTRAEELERVDWPDEQKNAFVVMQFSQQHQHYQLHFPDAGYYVLSQGETPVGRLYVHWKRGNALHLMDLTLAPEHRNRGIGTAIMHALMRETARSAERMTLYVEGFNPAFRLYQRLGFQPAETHGIYSLMEWKP